MQFTTPFLILGHRGACSIAPENTCASFDAALSYGVDGFEFDIQMSKDGEPVVIHDDTLERTTNGTGFVDEYTAAELKRFTAGEYQGVAQQIMTFKEVLDHVDGRCNLYIEIKNPAATHAVVEQLMQAVMHGNWRYEQLYILSFNHSELVKAKQLCADLRTCALIVGIPTSLAKIAEDAGAWSINPAIDHITQELVDDAHARGLKVLAWTVNEPRYLARAQRYGVDGVFSDTPQSLQSAHVQKSA